MKKSGKSIQMVLALLAAGTLLLNGCSAAKPAEKKSIRIGVTLYRGDDAFINNIRSLQCKLAMIVNWGTALRLCLFLRLRLFLCLRCLCC